MIAIIDYGAGNLRSVTNALDEIGAAYAVKTSGVGLGSFRKMILPGVGHFGQMMRALDERDLRRPVLDWAASGKPLLGICVGLQCMFAASEEAPGEQGLGLFEGVVKRFPMDARVPHMGWNSLDRVRETPLLDGLGEHPYVYFAHSFHAPLCGATAASCTYGFAYTAVLRKDNVHAVQFHPEKSGPAGLKVMRNFVESC